MIKKNDRENSNIPHVMGKRERIKKESSWLISNGFAFVLISARNMTGNCSKPLRIRISKLSSDWTSQHHLKEILEYQNVAESQIDEPASYGIGIENISIYFRASSKEKNRTVDFFVKPIFFKKQLKIKKKNRNFHFRFRPELIFSVKLNWIYYLYCLNNIHEARRGER